MALSQFNQVDIDVSIEGNKLTVEMEAPFEITEVVAIQLLEYLIEHYKKDKAWSAN